MNSGTQNDVIAQVWDELADFDAARIDEACHHLVTALAGMARAKNVGWVGVVRTVDEPRDPLHGWRVAKTSYLIDDSLNASAIEELKSRWARREVDPLSIYSVQEAGARFRAFSIRQAMRPDWFDKPYYKNFYEGRGVYDCIVAVFPLTQDAECSFVVHASPERGAFSADDVAQVARVLRGLKWFLRRLMLEHSLLLASSPLSPAERRTLAELLTDATEKEIATRLELTSNTVHQYAKAIYRKYGVKGRAGLMSLWLNRMP